MEIFLMCLMTANWELWQTY